MDSTSGMGRTGGIWLVGAAFGGKEDQTNRFLENDMWEIRDPGDKEVALIKSMRPGDQIAIKSTYVRKKDLPFDNRGQDVSVMGIKAIGKVKENPGDGLGVRVEWEKTYSPPREWYFYTYRRTIWRVSPDKWAAEALIKFTVEEKPQEIKRFLEVPYWRERYGTSSTEPMRFNWTKFFIAVSEKLLPYKDRRSALVAGIQQIASRLQSLNYLQDQFSDGRSGFLRDICPFTVMGMFNRGNTDSNRKVIAAELAELLGVSEPVPDSFEGIPTLHPLKSWFFPFEKDRGPKDIDNLWEVFSQAIRLSDSDDPDARKAFTAAYDEAAGVSGVGWNLTMGLYWVKPWDFPTLDEKSRHFLSSKLLLSIGTKGAGGRCSADDYLTLMDNLQARFQEEAYPVHSFPELSLAAWLYKDSKTITQREVIRPEGQEEDANSTSEIAMTIAPIKLYSVEEIMKDGCFLDRLDLEKMLDTLLNKKNLILQGPPGTGKTWLAKKLAFALIGQHDESKIRAVQFHPNYSYEDFVRGWRPIGDGRLSLEDGPFLKMVQAAAENPTENYVLVVEEINRGNPAQIFGEMLTLLEDNKRTPDEALELSYKQVDGERVFIPHNLYVIGTMNIADRSLALVDLALRRRFAFIDLEPVFGEAWQNWVNSECGIAFDVLNDIESRLNNLNNQISEDTRLGPQFRLGHSYVTPQKGTKIENAHEWFRRVVDTEINPLLNEYWFDDWEKAYKARKALLEGF